MRKILGLILMLSIIFPFVSIAKEAGNKSKISQEKTHKLKTKKNKKLTKVQKIRTAQNINKPQEGEILKIEGMVRDLNEQ
ncbi:hypothetical protein [Thermocrinis sp.]